MNLAEARFHKKTTQWDLCLKTGISQSKISLIERGYITPRYDEKKKLAQALGMKPNEITWCGKADGLGPLESAGSMSS